MKKEDKKAYEEALEIVKIYEAKLSNEFVQNKTCCICKDNVIENIDTITHPLEQEKGMWSSGTVDKISVGYGSIHDEKQFYIAICDSCIESLEKDGYVTDIEKLRKEINK